MTPRQSVAAILKELNSQGLGVRELAAAAGLSSPFVSRLIRGERGSGGLAPAVVTKLVEGLQRLARLHAERASACRKGIKAIRSAGRIVP